VATDPEFARQLRKEGQFLARLEHPRIVLVYDMDVSHDPPYIVMEYVEGGDLRKLLDQGPLPVERAVQIMLDVLEALTHAHGQGVIHRDIKPSNILLDSDGRAKVSDFGLGHITEGVSKSWARLESVRSGSGGTSGTLKYMSPEQFDPSILKGEPLDHRSDLYSVGIVFYEMLTGEFPSGLRPALPSEERPEIPAGFDEVFLKCTAGRRDGRYASAESTVAEMRRVWRGEAVELKDVSNGEEKRAAIERLVWVLATRARALQGGGSGTVVAARERAIVAFEALKSLGEIYPEDPTCATLIREAVAAYRDWVRLDQENPDAWQGLAECYEYSLQSKEAIPVWEEAIRLRPNDPGLRTGLAKTSYSLERYGDSLAALQQAVRLAPRDADVRVQIARTLVALDRRKQAIAEFRKAVALRPLDAEIHAELGDVYRLLGRDRRAIAAYREALRLYPAHWWARFSLYLLYRRRRPHDAIQVCEEGTRRGDTSERARWFHELGEIYTEDLRDYERAITAYKEAIDLEPDEYEHCVGLGNALIEAGRAAEGLRAYEKAVEVAEKAAAVGDMLSAALAHYELGEAHLRVGNRDGALAQLAILRSMDEEWYERLKEKLGEPSGD